MMRRDGCARAPALAVAVGIVVAGLAVGALLAGCGASPIRQHAIAARSVIAVLRSSEVAITEATRMSLGRCEGESIADARLDCIDRVAEVAERAASGHDVLMAPAQAYRDAVLESGGEETPELVAYLEIVSKPLRAGWPHFAAALRALGVPVPPIFAALPEVE